MSAPDAVMVLTASYPDEASAEADYGAVKALYQEIRTSHDFDAAVISRDEDGKVHVGKKHEQPTRGFESCQAHQGAGLGTQARPDGGDAGVASLEAA
jgi:uncharacterized membrane protein